MIDKSRKSLLLESKMSMVQFSTRSISTCVFFTVKIHTLYIDNSVDVDNDVVMINLMPVI